MTIPKIIAQFFFTDRPTRRHRPRGNPAAEPIHCFRGVALFPILHTAIGLKSKPTGKRVTEDEAIREVRAVYAEVEKLNISRDLHPSNILLSLSTDRKNANAHPR